MTDNEFFCPKCGCRNEVVDEFEYLPWNDEEESELECENCGQKVIATAHVHIDHTYRVVIDGMDYDVSEWGDEYYLAYDRLHQLEEDE